MGDVVPLWWRPPRDDVAPVGLKDAAVMSVESLRLAWSGFALLCTWWDGASPRLARYRSRRRLVGAVPQWFLARRLSDPAGGSSGRTRERREEGVLRHYLTGAAAAHELRVFGATGVLCARHDQIADQLVVLDEPTAALDPRAERDLFETVDSLYRSRSALLIPPRLSSVRFAHRICVLAVGRIVETGTHDELLATGGAYAELFELQARAYR